MIATPAKSGANSLSSQIRPLTNGDRLSLAEFKRLYAIHTKIRKAELLEGVVYMASPPYFPHAQAQALAISWLFSYHCQTPNTLVTGRQSVELDADNEVQPDALMWIKGDVALTDSGLVVGAPNLVVEVAASTVSYDLGVKKNVYRRNGVQEYLVFAAYEQEVFWFSLHEGTYRTIEPEQHGIYKSQRFPGLWLDSAAFWQNDTAKLLATLNNGLQSDSHSTFLTLLQNNG